MTTQETDKAAWVIDVWKRGKLAYRSFCHAESEAREKAARFAFDPSARVHIYAIQPPPIPQPEKPATRYYVFNPDGSVPRYKHGDEQSARTEAERLAKLAVGQTFEVLAIVASVKVSRPKPIWSDGYVNEQVPF